MALYRLQSLAAWASNVLFLCGTTMAFSAWGWIRTGGHWYPTGIRTSRLCLVLGIYAVSRSRIAPRYPSTVMKCCVIPIVLITLSITLENPEVEVHYHAILGETRRTIQHVFRWLEHTVSAAEFDAILAAASKELNTTSISDTALFPMGCVAQELEHAAPNVIDRRCHQHADFVFNLILGHAFQLWTTVHSGMTCWCCIASWFLFQLSSTLVLRVHNVPSLHFYRHSIVAFQLVCFLSCWLISHWVEWQANTVRINMAQTKRQQQRRAWQEVQTRRRQRRREWQAILSYAPNSFASWASTAEYHCISETSSNVSDDRAPAPVSNLWTCDGVFATRTESGELVSTVEAAMGNDDVGFNEVTADNLAIGAKAPMFRHSAQAIALYPGMTPDSFQSPPSCWFIEKNVHAMDTKQHQNWQKSYLSSPAFKHNSCPPDFFGRPVAFQGSRKTKHAAEDNTIRDSRPQGREVLKIQCCSGVQATCTPDHRVLLSDDVGFKKVTADATDEKRHQNWQQVCSLGKSNSDLSSLACKANSCPPDLSFGALLRAGAP